MAFKIMGMKHKREKYKSKSIRLTEKKARIEALLFVLYQLSTVEGAGGEGGGRGDRDGEDM